MIFLLELEPVDPATGSTVVLRYGSAGYTTEPGDTPANAYFEPRISDPGNIERHLFGAGRTRGTSDVGGGDIQLSNPDGALDGLLDLAFDGRTFRLFGLEDEQAPWSSRETLLVGSMEQAEFPSRQVQIRVRDRLALLREVIQTGTYLGTTINGGMTVAEGNSDLKDVRKPKLFGGPARNIPAINVDQFDNLYQVSDGPIAAVTAVRDTGVLLTATQDYPTLAALKAATLTASQFATCLALGLVRTGVRPDGTLTVDAAEGATVADRSAARIVQRIVAGVAGVTIDAGDVATLHAASPAPCEIWVDTSERQVLDVAASVLASVGGYLTVDRFGTLRIGRLALASGAGEMVVDENNMLERGESLSRLAPDDDGDGLPAISVTVRWGRAYSTFSESDLRDVAADDAYRAFAVQEWRLAKVESAANKALYPKGPELVFDSSFVAEADALDEAQRLMTIYGARRDFFRVSLASDEVKTIDLNDVVTLSPNRFGMADGVPTLVTGVVATFSNNTTELEVWR